MTNLWKSFSLATNPDFQSSRYATLRDIRIENPEKIIIGLADNSKPHTAKDTLEFAEELGINLVFLPPYSPDLNPIEYIWKSIKRIISHSFIKDAEHLKEIIESAFLKYAVKLSFARGWIERFISSEDRSKVFGS
jgi:putative transposase